MSMIKPVHDAPPSLACKILSLTIPLAVRDALIGDLVEEYREDRLPNMGRPGATVWFWKQTLLASYEYLNKQQGGVMAFLFSVIFFFAILTMLMLFSGEMSMFANWPSLVGVIPPAIVIGVACTSMDSMKLCIKLVISEQGGEERAHILAAQRFAKVTGDTSILLGIIGTLIAFIAIATNIQPERFSEVFGQAFAVSMICPLYAVIFKVILFTMDKRIENRYLSEA